MIVKIIETINKNILIEWEDDNGLHRGTVPEETLNGNVIDDTMLSLAIPFGVEWEFVLEDFVGEMTPQNLASSLRKAGIWTFEDLRARPQKALQVIQSIYGVDLSSLIRSTRMFVKDLEDNKHGNN